VWLEGEGINVCSVHYDDLQTLGNKKAHEGEGITLHLLR
jgi:hypothetical protein